MSPSFIYTFVQNTTIQTTHLIVLSLFFFTLIQSKKRYFDSLIVFQAIMTYQWSQKLSCMQKHSISVHTTCVMKYGYILSFSMCIHNCNATIHTYSIYVCSYSSYCMIINLDNLAFSILSEGHNTHSRFMFSRHAIKFWGHKRYI